MVHKSGSRLRDRSSTAAEDRVGEIGIGQVDYIANFSNTDLYWTAMADIIAPEGAICSIVENAEPLDLNILKRKSVTFAWEFMFTKSMFNTPNMEAQGALLNEVAKANR